MDSQRGSAPGPLRLRPQILGALGAMSVRGPESPAIVWGPEGQGLADIRGPRILVRPFTGAKSKKKSVKVVGPQAPLRPYLKPVRGVGP